MIERRKQELGLVQKRYGDIQHGSGLEWVVIKRWVLPAGWNKSETAILVLIPPGYPITPPDNFYADNDLRLSNDSTPGNASLNSIQLDRPWLQFSYHVEASDWQPNSDLLQCHNLLTFLQGVANRLGEVN
jgi:hypothetical protein